MEQLKNKDEEYVKAIKKQNDDIDDLIKAMQEQYKDMRNDYIFQLEAIETQFDTERAKILQRNENEIKSLFTEQKQVEEKFMRQRADKEEEYTKELEELRTNDANDQAKQKIQLEKEMQILQSCMEDMKAVYKLNEEKLEFNHKVLQDRQIVNGNVNESLRRRERRLKGTKIAVHKNFITQQKVFETRNKQLTKDYKRFTRDYIALQIKFQRFESIDKNRFNLIWSMNQNEVKALTDKIMDCDRVIHVQQLGIPWQPPSDPIFKSLESGQPGATGGQSMIGG